MGTNRKVFDEHVLALGQVVLHLAQVFAEFIVIQIVTSLQKLSSSLHIQIGNVNCTLHILDPNFLQKLRDRAVVEGQTTVGNSRFQQGPVDTRFVSVHIARIHKELLSLVLRESASGGES